MQIDYTFVDTKEGKDIEISLDSKKFLMLGAAGKARELGILKQYQQRKKEEVLPVFLGIGMGHAISAFLKEASAEQVLCIIDKENLLDQEEYRELLPFLQDPRVLLIREKNPKKALQILSSWQKEHKDLPFFPLTHMQYMRIDKEYYKKIQEDLTASLSTDFWSKVRRKRFTGEKPRILMLASRYFLLGEVVNACERLGIEHRLVLVEDNELLREEFISLLLKNVLEFDPDMLLTMNHLGIDREGIVTDLLARMELPLASWFVDNPHLVLYSYPKLACEWLTIFTYDKDNIDSLKNAGYEYVYYLPLGTDFERFHPRNKQKAFPKEWRADISFVGNSMCAKVAKRLEAAKAPRELIREYKNIALNFLSSPLHSVLECMEESFPHLLPFFHNIDSIERKLAFETLITWEATRVYRLNCFRETFAHKPLVVGDTYWHGLLRKEKVKYRFIDALGYYDELPRFYCHSTINFNATSMQMKNAINQRIFDIPASGSFVLTDWREQMDELLESGTEIISYKDKEEIPELIDFYLKNESARKKIIEKGRARVLSEHTWDKRVKDLIHFMKKRYN